MLCLSLSLKAPVARVYYVIWCLLEITKCSSCMQIPAFQFVHCTRTMSDLLTFGMYHKRIQNGFRFARSKEKANLLKQGIKIKENCLQTLIFFYSSEQYERWR